MSSAPAWSQVVISPESSGLHYQGSELLTELGEAENRARELIAQGRFIGALAVLDPLLQVRPVDANIQFLAGLASMGAADRPGLDENLREKLLDGAIQFFRVLLVEDPSLVRVRLEIGRAFFLKGEDVLARKHFEAVLAGNPPAPVVINVRRFLGQIRARRKWTTSLGFAIAPDSNIGGQSTERIIYVPGLPGLPFERDQANLTESGVGVSIWGGAEYQHPVGPRTRLRSGVNLSRREYSGGRYDRMNVSVHIGPRWLISNRSEVSLLATTRWDEKANDSYSDEYGIRMEWYRRFDRRTTGKLTTYFGKRRHDNLILLDGPVVDVFASVSHILTPSLRGNLNIGWSKNRPESEEDRNTTRQLGVGMKAALPKGFTLGGSVSMRWTDFDTQGRLPQIVVAGGPREDLIRSYRMDLNHRGFTLRGFSPRLSLVSEERTSNAQVTSYEREFAELSFVRLF